MIKPVIEPRISAEGLPDLVARSSPHELAGALRDLTPEQRAGLVPELVAHERRLRAEPVWSWQPHVRHGVAVAAASLMPNAAALEPWLMGFADSDTPADLVLDVLRGRAVAWLPELAERLVGRLSPRSTNEGVFHLAVVLMQASGIPVPDTDGFVFHYMRCRSAWWLHERPRWTAALPPVLKNVVGGSGVDALVAMARDRPLDRGVLIDACLARLAQQPAGRTEIIAFLALYQALDPQPDEIATRIRDLMVLLPDSHPSVAAMAQRALRQLDHLGRLGSEELCDAGRLVLGRSEKRLIRTQLAWMAASAGRHPDHSDGLVLAAIAAFGHVAADVQGRALAFVLRHLDRTSPATRAEIVARAAALPPDLASKVPGGAALPSAVPPTVLAAHVPRVMAPPITEPAELAGVLRRILRHAIDRMDAIDLERVLAALVEFAHRDRAELAAALAPVFDRDPLLEPAPATWEVRHGTVNAPDALRRVIGAACAPAAAEPGREGAADEGRAAWLSAAQALEEPERAIASRLQEIAIGLTFAPRPALVSTPTTATGTIEPAVLAERLRAAAAAGWEPWPLDLAHARLRLPAPDDDTGSQIIRHTAKYSYDEQATVQAYLAAVPQVGPIGPTDGQLRRRQANWPECWPAMLPSRRDAAAGHLLPYLLAHVRERGAAKPLLPLLAAAEGPIFDGMRVALAYGLGAARPENRIHSVDAMVVLAAREQLDGGGLGAVIGQLAAERLLLLPRIVPALRDVAARGAAPQVWTLLAHTLSPLWPVSGARPVRGLADLVALAVEVAQQLRPTEPVAGLAEAAAAKRSDRVTAEARRLAAALEEAAVAAP